VKVLVIGIRGMPSVEGGIETHAEQLYPRLAVLGCKIEALVRTPFVPRHTGDFGLIRIRRLWSPRKVGYEALIHSILGVLYAGLVRPDILHIHGIGPAIVTPIARLFGLKVVVTHHGQDYAREKWGPFGRRVLRLGERLGMRHSHARIAISKTISDFVLAEYARKTFLIPNGVVPVEPSTGGEHLHRFGLTPGRYFLQVGRMVPEKRQLDLIRAYVLAKPRGWKLALVGALGNDSYSRSVEAAGRDAGAVLTRYLRGEALEQIYSHAGAFVLPSSHEGLPIALLEASSYGLPVLASDIPANIEVSLDPSDYFPLGDIASLTDRLTQLANTPSDESARARRRQWVTQHYDWDRIADQTLQVYRSIR